MNFERMLRQKVTYWGPTGDTDRYGKALWEAPEVFICRWEDKAAQVMNKNGEEFTSKSRVYLINEVQLNGYVLLGEFLSDAVPPDDSYEIQQVGTTPDIGNLQQLTTVYL